jgi:hypothetical protein
MKITRFALLACTAALSACVAYPPGPPPPWAVVGETTVAGFTFPSRPDATGRRTWCT